MKLVEIGYACDRVSRGDKFIIGNGVFGYRGTLEENVKTDCVALNVAGLYDKNGSKWRETVNAPNPLYALFYLDGVKLGDEHAKEHEETLDTDCAVFSRKTVFCAGGANLTVTSQRFFNQANTSELISKLTFESDAACKVKIESGIDADVWNLNGSHFTVTETMRGDELTVKAVTEELRLALCVSLREKIEPAAGAIQSVSANKAVNVYSFQMSANSAVTLVKFCSIEIGNECGKNDLERTAKKGFDALFCENEKWWERKWEIARVEIEGDEQAEKALNFSIYQLLILTPRKDCSISARGLSGQTYKGAVFWDTEMFMLPFYLATDKTAAEKLAEYRIKTLGGALAKAEYYGYDGAFYAWESQDGGREACSDFNVTDVFTGRPVRTYFRDKQIHISADVALALFKCYEINGDVSLLSRGGAEVILECAVFYMSYAYFNCGKNRFELLDVLGPDEYHERVNNNAYTNYLAHETVGCALNCLKILKKLDVAAYALLKRKYGGRLKALKRFYRLLYLPQPNKDGVIEQFDGYFRLEDITPETAAKRLADSKEYWGGSNGVATATRVIKQADTVALMCVLPHLFDDATKLANYEYYLPYTEHGSSLSASMYALCGCFVNKPDEAYKWFLKTASVDLSGESKKFAGRVYIGGSHPAAAGGAYMTAVMGFCGLRYEGGKVCLRSVLPSNISCVTFGIDDSGTMKKYKVYKDKTEVTLL